MKKWFIGCTLFLSVYLFFVIVEIPAQWVLNQVTLPKNVILQGVKGTVWQANIERVVVNDYAINQVNTDVNVLSIFTFNPSIDVTFGGALVNGPEGKATLSDLFGQLTLTDTQISVPANDIAKQLLLPIPVVAKKYLDISLSRYVMGAPVCGELKGNVRWDNASITALDQSVVLGSLKGDLTCDKGIAQFSFDPKNNLGLTLSVSVYSPKRVAGTGFIKPGKQFPKQLKDVLPFLGKPDKEGQYKLNF